MMTLRTDRQIPKGYIANFLKAAEAEIGSYSLRMILRDAGLGAATDQAPIAVMDGSLQSSEFAAVQAAVRAYYGSGARGSLNRIGRLAWQGAVANTFKGWFFFPIVRKLMTPQSGSQFALNRLADLIKKSDGDVSVHLFDTDLIFMDTSSDATFNQQADKPICWYTVGMIQASIAWAIGEEIAVDEITCRAMGAEACKFKVDI